MSDITNSLTPEAIPEKLLHLSEQLSAAASEVNAWQKAPYSLQNSIRLDLARTKYSLLADAYKKALVEVVTEVTT